MYPMMLGMKRKMLSWLSQRDVGRCGIDVVVPGVPRLPLASAQSAEAFFEVPFWDREGAMCAIIRI